MALPTLTELLAAMNSVPGPASAVTAAQGGLERGKAMAAAVAERQLAQKKAEAEMELQKAQAGYYDKRDPLTELLTRNTGALNVANVKSDSAEAIAEEKRKADAANIEKVVAEKLAAAKLAAGVKDEATDVSAAGKLLTVKEPFSVRALRAVHNVGAAIIPGVEHQDAPKDVAGNFLRNKLQGTPAPKADPDAAAKAFLLQNYPELKSPTPEDIAWAKGQMK